MQHNKSKEFVDFEKKGVENVIKNQSKLFNTYRTIGTEDVVGSKKSLLDPIN